MNAIELKRELHSFIDQEDDRTLEMLYQMVQSYKIQKRKDKMIAEGDVLSARSGFHLGSIP